MLATFRWLPDRTGDSHSFVPWICHVAWSVLSGILIYRAGLFGLPEHPSALLPAGPSLCQLTGVGSVLCNTTLANRLVSPGCGGHIRVE